MGDGMNLYELRDVRKNYNSFEYALDKINLKIKKGDFVVITGPSGSGKSTLLNVLAGIDKVTSGSILFLNSRIDLLSNNEITEYRKKYIGFIFQNYVLIPSLNVYENVLFGSMLSSNNLDINDILSAVGLNNKKYKYPFELSGGERQRVAIARALVKKPTILFGDEITGALDVANEENILKVINDIKNKYNMTIIMVTHNPSILKYANMVIKMNSGHINSIYYNED